MKIAEIREMNMEQLKKFIGEKRAQSVRLRFDISAKQVKNHREYRSIRKDISKALTILKEKEV